MFIDLYSSKKLRLKSLKLKGSFYKKKRYQTFELNQTLPTTPIKYPVRSICRTPRFQTLENINGYGYNTFRTVVGRGCDLLGIDGNVHDDVCAFLASRTGVLVTNNNATEQLQALFKLVHRGGVASDDSHARPSMEHGGIALERVVWHVQEIPGRLRFAKDVLAATDDHHRHTVALFGLRSFHFIESVESRNDLPEDHVFAVTSGSTICRTQHRERRTLTTYNQSIVQRKTDLKSHAMVRVRV
jgi:hypothetical protein